MTQIKLDSMCRLLFAADSLGSSPTHPLDFLNLSFVDVKVFCLSMKWKDMHFVSNPVHLVVSSTIVMNMEESHSSMF